MISRVLENSEFAVQDHEKLTYLNCVEHNGHNVAGSDRLTVLWAIIITTVAQLSIIKGPSVLCIAEGLLKK